MNEFTIVAVIGRPVDEVFAVIRDVDQAPLWMPVSAPTSPPSESAWG
jgi:hypothetical protein